MGEIYLIFIFITFLFFVGTKLFSLGIQKEVYDQTNLRAITVVVPFRNEERNLAHLFNSIKGQSLCLTNIIFIDDHSEDTSVELVKEFVNEIGNATLLHLPASKTGKKEALNYGIEQVRTDYVLTIDADVVLNPNHFELLSKIVFSGITSFPVIMKGKRFIERIFSVEYMFFNSFNFLIAPIWPISISGANLLIDLKKIDYHTQFENHKHISSGDDYFLLKDARKKKVPVFIYPENSLSVTTNAPQSIRSYLDQRVRWLSKTKHQLDWKDTLIGVYISIYLVGGGIVLVATAIQGEWLEFLSVFVLRFLIDSLIFLNYGRQLRISKEVIVLPLFQIFYPVLFLFVLFLSIFYTPLWKGRK